jgi:YVTN family beta-propeller protein
MDNLRRIVRAFATIAWAGGLAGAALVIVLGLAAGTGAAPAPASPSQPATFQVSTIALPTESPTRAHPSALAIQPRTGLVYVASTGRHEIVVISGSQVISAISTHPPGAKPCLPEFRPSSGLYCLTDLEAHPLTGYVYATEWQSDDRLVISSTQLVATIAGSIQRWNGPVALAVNPSTPAAYVGAAYIDQVGTICAVHAIARHVTGPDPIALAVDERTGYVYAAERGSNRLTIVQRTGVTTGLTVGQGPTALAVHPQSRLVYVANGGSDDVSIVSGTAVVATPTVGGISSMLGPSTGDGYIAYGSTGIIAFGPGAGYVYVTNWDSGTISVISHTSVISTLAVGGRPNAIVASPLSGRIFAANPASNSVAVISGTAVITTLQVVSYPIDLAVHPMTGDVYVAGRDGDALSVIHEADVTPWMPAPSQGRTPTRSALTPLLFSGRPDSLLLSGDVLTGGSLAGCNYLAGMPAGSIALGIDPDSCAPGDGGSASLVLTFTHVSTPLVATVFAIWPDFGGRGLYATGTLTPVAAISRDEAGIWLRKTVITETGGRRYGAASGPAVTTLVLKPSAGPLTATVTFSTAPGTVWDLSRIVIRATSAPTLERAFAYGPFRPGQSPDLGIFPTEDEIRADMPILANTANAIRTYGVAGTQALIPALAQEVGLDVALGAWVDASTVTASYEITQVIALAQAYTNVRSIVVGNEVLLRNEMTPGRLASLVQYVGANTPPSVSVTTADTWHEWQQVLRGVEPGAQELVDAVDYVLIHVHPYWESQDAGDAAQYVLARATEVRGLLACHNLDKRVVVGETGWPDGGPDRPPAHPSPANQQRFVDELMALADEAGIGLYYFEAFDEPWKVAREGPVGGHWGVCYSDRSSKLMRQGFLLDHVSRPFALVYLPIVLRN